MRFEEVNFTQQFRSERTFIVLLNNKIVHKNLECRSDFKENCVRFFIRALFASYLFSWCLYVLIASSHSKQIRSLYVVEDLCTNTSVCIVQASCSCAAWTTNSNALKFTNKNLFTTIITRSNNLFSIQITYFVAASDTLCRISCIVNRGNSFGSACTNASVGVKQASCSWTAFLINSNALNSYF